MKHGFARSSRSSNFSAPARRVDFLTIKNSFSPGFQPSIMPGVSVNYEPRIISVDYEPRITLLVFFWQNCGVPIQRVSAGMILVTGGSGYIGSHTCVSFRQAGHGLLILDYLCNSRADVVSRLKTLCGRCPGFIEGDIRDGAPSTNAQPAAQSPP